MLITKHLQVLQGSHSCFGPQKAFSFALRLCQEHFPQLKMNKHHFLQKKKGELMGNAQRPCYSIPGQAHKLTVPSESTLNITHQQKLHSGSQPLQGTFICINFILNKCMLRSGVADRHGCIHLFSVLNQCLQMDVSSKHRRILWDCCQKNLIFLNQCNNNTEISGGRKVPVAITQQ